MCRCNCGTMRQGCVPLLPLTPSFTTAGHSLRLSNVGRRFCDVGVSQPGSGTYGGSLACTEPVSRQSG